MSLASEIAKLRAKQAAAARRPAAPINRRPAAPLRRLPVRAPNPVNPRMGAAAAIDPRNFLTGVINPVGVPPANASPPPAIGGSLLDAIRGLQRSPTSLGPVANNRSLPNIGMRRLPRAGAEFGMPPSTGVVSNPLLQSDGNLPFLPWQGNSLAVANPSFPQENVPKTDAFFSSPEYRAFLDSTAGQPATMDMYNSPYFGTLGSGSVGRAQDEAYRKYMGSNAQIGNPPAVGVGGTAETGYAPPFGNTGLFGSSLMPGGMARPVGALTMPAPNNMGSLGQSFAQYTAGLFGQQPNMNQFYNMNTNQGMGQSLGSIGSMGFGGQFNNMQPQMAMQQFSQQGQPPSFADSFAYRPL